MQKQTIDKVFQNIDIFSSLEENELYELKKISHIYTYNEGSRLFVEGEINTDLMIILEGVVSIHKHDAKGNEVVMGYFKRNDLIAEAATLRQTPLPSSATFKTDGSILKIDIISFKKLFITHPKISYMLIESLLGKIELLQQNIHFNLASSSLEKILHFYKKNPTLSLDLKQYEIASLLGMTAETFSRNLKKLLQEKKLVKTATGFKYLQHTSNDP